MRLRTCASIAAFVLTGCQAPGASIDSLEPHAVDVAVRRAQLDAMCASIAPSVLDRTQARAVTPATADATFEYTIAVAGCGQHKTYRVVCPAVGAACFVAPERSGG